ncbi:MAG: methylenetetrahydrofolate reductase [NAD(P)H] [Bacteroidetes bacterium]|nr:MAG: methylenetetrahydrofolate reductase [NAD(P)H] [Bacteroidota bacterium]
MKVTEILENSKETVFSFEILPPLKGKSIQEIYDGIDPLLEFEPKFINVTYHREEYVYKKREKGYLEKVSIRKRPGTVSICAAIKNKYNIETVPHLICGGFTKEETENALIELNFLGIDNVLALRGDPIKTETHFVPEEGGHRYAVELVEQIKKMNNGIFLDEDIKNAQPSNFCIGVAGYPEKHFEAMNLKIDLKHLKEKVDAGADYIVTQMFFDNQKYFDFVEKCKETGINVPIIPGLKPITTLNHINFLPKFFHVDFPEPLAEELEKCTSNEQVKQVGIEWAIYQAKELKKAGVPCIHFFTMGKSEATRLIAKEVF